MVAELERILDEQVNIHPSTHRIGRTLGHALALHRSNVFDCVDESTKRDMIRELNWPISLGNALVEEALDRFHSHLFKQTGRRKTADTSLINSIVELANGKI